MSRIQRFCVFWNVGIKSFTLWSVEHALKIKNSCFSHENCVRKSVHCSHQSQENLVKKVEYKFQNKILKSKERIQEKKEKSEQQKVLRITFWKRFLLWRKMLKEFLAFLSYAFHLCLCSHCVSGEVLLHQPHQPPFILSYFLSTSLLLPINAF